MGEPGTKRHRSASWMPGASFRLHLVTVGALTLALTWSPDARAQTSTFANLAQTTGAGTSAPTASVEKSSPEDAAAAAGRAKQQFALGNQAYEQGNYREAAEAFERAHALSPHSAVLFNAARAWWKMGESERAADDYAAAIARGELTTEQSLRARSALSNLRQKLGWIIVSGPSGATASVGHKQDTVLPFTAHLTPGEHLLVVEHAGETWEQIVTVQADAPLSVVAQKDRPPPVTGPRAPPVEAPPPSNRQRNWGWFTLGMGGALGTSAIVTGALTLRARDDFNSFNDGSPENLSTAEFYHRRAKTLRTVTNILAFSGGATALTGLTLVLTAPRRTHARKSAEGLTLALDAHRIALQRSF